MKNNLLRLQHFINDPEKKSISEILKDVIHLTRLKGQFPLYYFGRFFYKKGAPDASDFMNLYEYKKILSSPCFKNKTTEEILSSKINFALFCEYYGLPTAKLIMYNIKNSLYINNCVKQINDSGTFIELIRKNICEFEGGIFIKADRAYGGKSIFRIDNNTTDKYLESLWEDLRGASFVFQSKIKQHPEIDRIYSGSINTIRIETYLNRQGTVEILGSFMRFGGGDSFVDNVSSGGFQVPIDLNTGCLREYGFRAMIVSHKRITHHPDTNEPVSGFQIPFFEESLELCKKFAQYIPHPIIGWDVAITPAGPIIIEGNHDAAIIASEFSYGGFRNHKAYKEINALVGI
jgi:hypothetical protein